MTPAYLLRSGAPAVEWMKLRPVYSAERFVAALALIVLSPLLAITAAALAILSKRGPLIRHRRVGWMGRPFGMLKFRTMWDTGCAKPPFRLIEIVTGTPHAPGESEDRVPSRFAALCRRYSLDELPQLYHVLRGEMSFVGPRPITRPELDEHYANCADEVLSLRPGMTGLWQIMGRKNLSYSARRRLDLILVRKASLALYIRVLLRSIPTVIQGKGAY